MTPCNIERVILDKQGEVSQAAVRLKTGTWWYDKKEFTPQISAMVTNHIENGGRVISCQK